MMKNQKKFLLGKLLRNKMVSNRVCQNCTKKNRKNMKTNKIGHFICGVLATYGLVVACGNMYNDIDTDSDNTLDQNPESDSRCPCILC